MVVADNSAYEYDVSQYLEQEVVVKPNLDNRPKTKKKTKPKAKAHITSIIFVFSIAVLLLARYAFIAEINFDINKLQKDYKNALKENSDLNVQLMRSVNLENLEKLAIEKLRMQYPDSSQFAYVNVNLASNDGEGKQKDFYSINEVQENKYIAVVKDVLGKAVKLLD